MCLSALAKGGSVSLRLEVGQENSKKEVGNDRIDSWFRIQR